MWIHNGNVKRTWRRRHLPWGEFSPLLNSPARAETHGIASSGEVVFRLVEHRIFVVSGAQMTVLENPGECLGSAKGFSRLVVPITAAGLQGEQPLVDGRM